MALVTDKLVYLHIPKTAGVFFRHVFKVCKIAHIEVGEQHSHFPELFKYRPPRYFADKKLITFVRHPLTWYQSRWAFRVKHGWKAQHPLDYNCASNDFATFVDNVLRYQPDGWFSWECRSFIETTPRPIDFIGRVENLVEDTFAALELAGEAFTKRAIKSIPRVNDSDMGGLPSKYWAKYNQLLIDRVLAVEHDVLTKYYNTYPLEQLHL